MFKAGQFYAATTKQAEVVLLCVCPSVCDRPDWGYML